MGMSFKLVPSKSKDAKKSKYHTIYVRIAMSNKTADVSTHEKCLLKNWQKTKVKGLGSQEINQNINDVKASLDTIYKHLKKEAPLMLTAALVAKIYIEKVDVNKLLNPEIPKEKAIISILEELNQAKMDNKIFKLETFEQNKGYIKKIKSFLLSVGDENMPFADFNYTLSEKLVLNLREGKDLKNGYLKKITQLFTAGGTYARKKEYSKTDPFSFEPFKDDAEETHYLMMDELIRLQEYDFSENLVLDKARDVFVFSAYSGFQLVDMKAFLKNNHLQTDKEGKEWITKKRNKTGEWQKIPLFAPAKKILEKYDYVLPLKSRDFHNKKLAKISKLLAFEPKITNHCGRKTAGMVWLNEGADIGVVAAMLGHASIKTTEKHYAKLLTGTIGKATDHFFKDKK